MLLRTLLLFALSTSAGVAQPTLTAPATAGIGSEVAITVAGSTDQRDFVTIVPKGSKDGAYDSYQYVAKPTLKLMTPVKPGDYEIRLLAAQSPYPTLASRPA